MRTIAVLLLIGLGVQGCGLGIPLGRKVFGERGAYEQQKQKAEPASAPTPAKKNGDTR